MPKEIALAEKRGKFILPYKIDDTELEGAFDYYLTGAHWIVADPEKGEYKFEEMYGVLAGVLQMPVQSITTNLYIDNITIQSSAPEADKVKDPEEDKESRAAIHQRVQRLIDMGVIIGSGYNVNPKSLGYRTCTYVGIKLEKGSMYKEAVKELKKIPEIIECHFTTGNYTMLTKLYCRDNEHLMELLNSKIQEIPGVTATETLISLEQSIKKEIPICME